jgi:hypothetical protein
MVTTAVNYLDQVDANNGNPLQCSSHGMSGKIVWSWKSHGKKLLWSEKVMEKLWDFVGTLLKHHCLI